MGSNMQVFAIWGLTALALGGSSAFMHLPVRRAWILVTIGGFVSFGACAGALTTWGLNRGELNSFEADPILPAAAFGIAAGVASIVALVMRRRRRSQYQVALWGAILFCVISWVVEVGYLAIRWY